MDPHSDPMVRDKKSLPMSSSLANLPAFLLSVGVVLPVWVTVLLPLTIASQLGIKAWKSVSPKRLTKARAQENPVELAQRIVKTAVQSDDREFDLVVFGATGFTGRLAALYLARQYGTSVRWAIAGRRRDALEKIRAEVAAIDPKLADLPIVIADSNDVKSLDALTANTKAVITTAGPFDRYGTPLVKSCAMHGTHYCDITGETDWVREMIDQFDDVAKASGARIVSFCGHDCVPWDLAVFKCAKALREKGDTIKEVRIYDEINSAPSGGTLETVFHTLADRVKYKSLLGFDPLLKTVAGEKSQNKIVVKNQTSLGYRKEQRRWVGPFVMADVMSNCIRRSNALNNYSSKLVYNEALVYANFTGAVVQFLSLLIFGTALFLPPLQWFMRAFVLPSPGQGPSEAFMDEGFLKIIAIAEGINGGKTTATFYFPTDPGYRDTARMLVESGLTLALEGERLKVGGGLFTPAACQGEVLLERLVNTGSSFHIE